MIKALASHTRASLPAGRLEDLACDFLPLRALQGWPLQRILLMGLWSSAVACGGNEADDGNGASEAMSSESTSFASTPTCELPNGGYPTECDSCLAEKCCEPIEACKANAECNAQLTCIVDCQHALTEPCADECVEPAGVHDGYRAYDDCSFSECLSTCWM